MSYGFIISRHVNSVLTNKYWNQCVKCIRRYYPDKLIVIIDDNSNPDFLKAFYEYNNVQIIQSEFPGRGELLPYYYFFKHHFFDNALIIHDSVFIHKKINFEKIMKLPVVSLWHFKKDKENISNTYRIASILQNKELVLNTLLGKNVLPIIKSTEWYGCFGVQSFISHHFLLQLQN